MDLIPAHLRPAQAQGNIPSTSEQEKAAPQMATLNTVNDILNNEDIQQELELKCRETFSKFRAVEETEDDTVRMVIESLDTLSKQLRLMTNINWQNFVQELTQIQYQFCQLHTLGWH